jgi:hypothetical protein
MPASLVLRARVEMDLGFFEVDEPVSTGHEHRQNLSDTEADVGDVVVAAFPYPNSQLDCSLISPTCN